MFLLTSFFLNQINGIWSKKVLFLLSWQYKINKGEANSLTDIDKAEKTHLPVSRTLEIKTSVVASLPCCLYKMCSFLKSVSYPAKKYFI